MPRLTHPAERPRVVVGERIVDPEGARRDFIRGAHRPFHIVRINICAKAVVGIVGQSYGLVQVFDLHHRSNGAERLFGHDLHPVVDVGQDRRLVKEAVLHPGRPLAPAKNLCSLAERVLDVGFHFPDAVGGDHRTNVGLRVHAVAELERAREFHHLTDQVVTDRSEHVKPFRAGADLAGVEKRGPCGGARGDLHVGIGTDDERVLAAELQVRLLHHVGADLSDAPARLGRTGHRDQVGARMADEIIPDIATAARDDVRDTPRKMGKCVSQVEGCQRRLHGGLDDDRVSSSQSRGRFPSQ